MTIVSSRDRGKANRADLLRFVFSRDPMLREKIIVDHVPYVRALARRFAYRGVPFEDLVQVGVVGLINAIDRYDPSHKTELLTYATSHIVGQIKRYFRDKSWSVKVPRRSQELSVRVSAAIDVLPQILGRSPTVKDICAHVGASEDDVIDARELHRSFRALSLDRGSLADDDSKDNSLAVRVGLPDPALDQVDARYTILAALRALNANEQNVVRLRFFADLSQADISRRLGYSQMQISRVQRCALAKMRACLA